MARGGGLPRRGGRGGHGASSARGRGRGGFSSQRGSGGRFRGQHRGSGRPVNRDQGSRPTFSGAAASLNKQILACARDRNALQQEISSNVAKYNVVNCVTALQGVTRCGGCGQDVLQRLLEKTTECFENPDGACESRHVSTAIWAVAKLGGDVTPSTKALLDAAIRCGGEHFTPDQFHSSEVSLSIWGLGKLHYTTPEACALATILIGTLESRQLKLAPQGFGSFLHGLGNLATVLGELELTHTLDRLHAARLFLNPQELANSLAGLSKVKLANVPEAEWFEGFKRAFAQNSSTFFPQHVANLVSAIARLHEQAGHGVLDLFDALGEPLLRVLPQMNTQELSMTVWALSVVVSPTDSRLDQYLPVILDRASTLYKRLDAQSMSTIALGLAKLDRPEFVHKIDLATVSGIPRWKAPDVDSLAVAFAKVDRNDEDAATILLSLGDQVSDQMPVRNVANITWGLAKCTREASQHKKSELHNFLRKMSALATEQLDAFNARDLSNFAWALATLGFHDSTFMQSLGDVASSKLTNFNAQECSKLLFALNKNGVRHEGLEKAASTSRIQEFAFPKASFDVSIEHIPAGGRMLQQKREATGATGATGGAIWESSYVLSEWLSRFATGEPTKALQQILGNKRAEMFSSIVNPQTTVVELGSGMGLCSITVAKLGARVIATDGDDQVLKLLNSNIRLNQVSNASASPLEWSCEDPLQALGLKQPVDFIVATGVVYGRDLQVWENLVEILRKISHSRTLILLGHGNGAAPGVHQLKGDFYRFAKEYFDCFALPASQTHRDHRGCAIHVLTKKTVKRELDEESTSSPHEESSTPKRSKTNEASKRVTANVVSDGTPGKSERKNKNKNKNKKEKNK